MQVPTKTLDELVAAAQAALAGTRLEGTARGDAVRLLLAAILAQLERYYKDLEEVYSQGFVSTATGDSLDLIGDLVGCIRRTEEPDEDYRYRIVNQLLTLATANRTALYVALMGIDGVKDVLFQEYVAGTGSGAVYLVIDDPAEWPRILQEAEQIVEQVKGFACRVEVLTPTLIPIGIKLALIFKGEISELDREYYRTAVRNVVVAYLNSRRPGETLLLQQIYNSIYGISDLIAEARVLELTREGRPVSVQDQTCRWNERFVEDGALGVRVV